MMQYQVFKLDSRGNEEDGYDVITTHDTGMCINIVNQDMGSNILDELIRASVAMGENILSIMSHPRRVRVTWVSANLIEIEDGTTGKPVLHLISEKGI
jgi:hypothetical protein